MARNNMDLDDVWNSIWRDKHGRIVLYQHPSPLLIGWLVLTIASLFVTGNLGNIVWYVALAVLAVWALLEVFKGVNYFRRILGLIVLVLIIAALLKVGY